MSSHTSVSGSDVVPVFRHLLSKVLCVCRKVLSNLPVLACLWYLFMRRLGFCWLRNWFVSLAAFPVLIVLVGFGFCVLVSLAGISSRISLEGFIWGVSGLVGVPRENSNRLAVFVWSDCTVFGVSVCAGGVICSTVFCGVVSGPGVVFIL